MKLNQSSSALLLAAMVFACGTSFAQDQSDEKRSTDKKFSAGLTFSETATPEDAGLPLYPGAIPHRNRKHDGDGVNLGFWGGAFGLKVIVVELETSDSPDKVAAFYQEALSRYGDVLDCSKRTASAEEKPARGKSRHLTCGRDRSEKKGLLYKVGTREKHRMAAIQAQSRGQGSVFQLIYIEMRGTD